MLEKPEIEDDKIRDCVREAYGLRVNEVTFLPLGADRNTAVYRIVRDDGSPYFLKLRGGVFEETSARLPRFLYDLGIEQIIAPVRTSSGALWIRLDEYAVILYPFVEGRDGYAANLSDGQWMELGAALKRMHTAVLPPEISRRIQRESYSSQWREIVWEFQARVERETFAEPTAAKLAAFLRAQRPTIDRLVGQAERLAAVMQVRSPAFVLCHADIHAGNVLITQDGRLYIVDWDTAVLAAKERDLMFVGGGLFNNWRPPDEEERVFYQGYGQTTIDPVALAYYRYERIVQDIAAYGEQLLLTDAGGADREVGLRQLTSQFLPDEVIDMAFRSDKHLPPELRFPLS